MHLQSVGNEHSGSGNGGASSLKKRFPRRPSAAGHAPDCPTTLTACHVCLSIPVGLVLVTICGISYVIRYYEHVNGGLGDPRPGIWPDSRRCPVRLGMSPPMPELALLSQWPSQTLYAQLDCLKCRLSRCRMYEGTEAGVNGDLARQDIVKVQISYDRGWKWMVGHERSRPRAVLLHCEPLLVDACGCRWNIHPTGTVYAVVRPEQTPGFRAGHRLLSRESGWMTGWPLPAR
jgi:hypothetical protein